jgi:hypothetical protein
MDAINNSTAKTVFTVTFESDGKLFMILLQSSMESIIGILKFNEPPENYSTFG